MYDCIMIFLYFRIYAFDTQTYLQKYILIYCCNS